MPFFMVSRQTYTSVFQMLRSTTIIFTGMGFPVVSDKRDWIFFQYFLCQVYCLLFSSRGFPVSHSQSWLLSLTLFVSFRKLLPFHWFAMVLVIVGSSLVGVSSILAVHFFLRSESLILKETIRLARAVMRRLQTSRRILFWVISVSWPHR